MATGWPLIARAQQQGERVRLVCDLEGISVNTPNAKERYTAFLERLQQLGWTPGRNVRIEVRWGEGDDAAIRKYAAELVALAPDVLVAGGGAATEIMLKATHTIPIVFVIVPDPVGSGFVESLSQPGANATGFMMFEYNLCGKWLELLKEIAPSVTHAAVLRDPTFAYGIGQFAVIQAMAPSVGIEVRPIDLREPSQIERAIATFAQRPNGGIILTASPPAAANVNLIITAAAHYNLPKASSGDADANTLANLQRDFQGMAEPLRIFVRAIVMSALCRFRCRSRGRRVIAAGASFLS
jgi:putative ABC transport system substrate-binding protein